jgi:hypothetical protein
MTEGAEEAGDAGGEAAESDEMADPMQGMEQLGEKLGQLFASAATYDIFIGSGFKVREAYLRDMSGTKRSAIEVIPLGEQSLVRFPLLGMISQDGNQKGFEIVVQLR